MPPFPSEPPLGAFLDFNVAAACNHTTVVDLARSSMRPGACYWLLTEKGSLVLNRGASALRLLAGSCVAVAEEKGSRMRLLEPHKGWQGFLLVFSGEHARFYHRYLVRRFGLSYNFPVHAGPFSQARRLVASARTKAFQNRAAAAHAAFGWYNSVYAALLRTRLDYAGLLKLDPDAPELALYAARSLKQLASDSGLSVSTLTRQLQERWQARPHHVLHRARLRYAQWLVDESALPIAKIAEMTGYESASMFARVFKRARGVTPSVARASPTRRPGPNSPPPEHPAQRPRLMAPLPRLANWHVTATGDQPYYMLRTAGVLTSSTAAGIDYSLDAFRRKLTWIYTLGGRARVTWAQESLTLSAGHAFVFSDPSQLRIRPLPASAPWRRIELTFVGKMAEDLFRVGLSSWGAHGHLPRYASPVTAALRLCRLCDGRRQWPLFVLSRLAFDWLILWLRWACSHPPPGCPLDLLHLETPIYLPDRKGYRVAEYARESGYSRAQFGRLIRRRWRDQPRGILRSRCLNDAAADLASSSIAVSKLAEKYDYSCSAAFSRAFRNFHGESPLQYRRNRRNK